MGRSSSESPVKARGSPRRRSPPRRERSPVRHRSSNAENQSSRNRSPKRGRSRSPVYRSPLREKPSSRNKSPKHRKVPSPVSRSRSPLKQRSSYRMRSPNNIRSRSPTSVSPVKEKSSSRMRSPKGVQNRSQSPDKRKVLARTMSPPHGRSRSSDSRSPSPRSKRLKRAKAEQAAEKGSENHGRKKSYRGTHEEKDLDRDLLAERNDRRPQRDAVSGSSKSRHRRSSSPSDRHHRGQRRSRSPNTDEREHDERTTSRDLEQRNGDSDSIAKMKAAEEKLEEKEKQKPSFELSGKLAAETNRFRGITLLYSEEPPDARKPDIRWRLYVFKAGDVLNEPLYVHRQSCYLFGRERRVVDIPTDHPSCSKQHAVLQYRQIEEENPDGTVSKRVRPYLMDLGSTNGTFINDNQIEAKRYYELIEKDTVKFGNSSREYVLLHENSAG
ncbi:FHA domain-containing protein DDL [Andrographis paniculata]|uniref:FHA domain-containing protein DDL n=1 Tax=Andrographis paniculata TaxID=175694 RepID=UPI0021E8667C|nr:FHA domain-containing protein DDL [Andrographis paniculata]XP_051133913.1 FHA domain-containing protein DDL [Andrographis paniculata]XP_051133914.1 FHA domain-containing protein DDL [Andrographis paniculata]